MGRNRTLVWTPTNDEIRALIAAKRPVSFRPISPVQFRAIFRVRGYDTPRGFC